MRGNTLIKAEERQGSHKSSVTCGLAPHVGFPLGWLAVGCCIVIVFDTGDSGELLSPSLASSSLLAYVSGRLSLSVHACRGSSCCPGMWFFSLEQFFLHQPLHSCQVHHLRWGRDQGMVTPSPYFLGFGLIWGSSSHSPSHPQTLLLWGLGCLPFTLSHSGQSFPSF